MITVDFVPYNFSYGSRLSETFLLCRTHQALGRGRRRRKGRTRLYMHMQCADTAQPHRPCVLITSQALNILRFYFIHLKTPSPYSVKALLSLNPTFLNFFAWVTLARSSIKDLSCLDKDRCRGYQPSWQTLCRYLLCKRHQVSSLSSRQRIPANKHGSMSPLRFRRSFRVPSCSCAYIPNIASSAMWT